MSYASRDWRIRRRIEGDLAANRRRSAPMESGAPNPNPTVEIIYRYPGDDAIAHKFLPWRRPQTDEALAEYINDYLEMVTSGYRPAGFETPPLPHCARVHFLGRVVAEWHISPASRSESILTERLHHAGQGGIPADSPLTPASGVGSSGRRAPFGIHPASAPIPQPQLAVKNASMTGDFGAEFGLTVTEVGHPVESRSHGLVR